jgi:hypothetical protein
LLLGLLAGFAVILAITLLAPVALIVKVVVGGLCVLVMVLVWVAISAFPYVLGVQTRMQAADAAARSLVLFPVLCGACLWALLRGGLLYLIAGALIVWYALTAGIALGIALGAALLLAGFIIMIRRLPLLLLTPIILLREHLGIRESARTSVRTVQHKWTRTVRMMILLCVLICLFAAVVLLPLLPAVLLFAAAARAPSGLAVFLYNMAGLLCIVEFLGVFLFLAPIVRVLPIVFLVQLYEDYKASVVSV